MADNTTINAQTGGDVIAADDIGGVKHQRVKVEFGADGAAQDVDATHPLPVVPSTPGDVATTLTDGRKTVAAAGTAEAIRAALACKWVLCTAYKTNTQPVAVGGSGVVAAAGSETGVPLGAGESVTIPVDNASKVFVDARVNGEGVTFTVGS